MAVRMSIGLDTACCKRKINLTQLRRNSRSRRDKTSGRKRPRFEDCDVVAAPDSLSSIHATVNQPGLSQSESFDPPMESSNPPTESPNPPTESPNPPTESPNPPTESPNPPMESSNAPTESSNPPMESSNPQVKPESLESGSLPHHGLQPESCNPGTSRSAPVTATPTNQQQEVDGEGVITINDGSSKPRKAKRRQRRKVRFDNQPGNNDNQPGSNDNFDKLYSAIRTGEKLDDGHISAACKMLCKQFPNIQGLYTPVLGQNLSFPPVNSMLLLAGQGYEYIQVLHTGADHWITISIETTDEVKVYDSMFHSTTYATKKQIASILHTKSYQVKLQIAMTQFQENSLDCGVYAIAFATDLCHGNDPSQFKYDLPFKLRMHLLDNLKAQKMIPFPSVKLKCRLGYLTEKMNIYCKCRLLYVAEHGFPSKVFPKSEDIHMIQCYTCEEWYHRSCVNLSVIEIKKLRKDDTKWLCEKCAENFDISSSDDSS